MDVDCGKLTIRWSERPEGGVLATCDQFPNFRLTVDRGEDLLHRVGMGIADHILLNYGLRAAVRPEANVAQFRLMTEH